MTISPLFEVGFERFQKCVFRIHISLTNGKGCIGTGFTLAVGVPSRTIYLATAKHVVEFARDKDASWVIQQFDDHGKVSRTVTFKTSAVGVPLFTVHNTLDVGVLPLPRLDDGGNILCQDDELMPMMIERDRGVSTGSRVGWAGFPAAVEQFLGTPQLCYFEGVVSAMVNHDHKRVYLVDGHVAGGVSGGPVWHFSDEHERFEIVGIVCAYGMSQKDLPGLCIFEPVNPLLYLIDSWNQAKRQKKQGASDGTTDDKRP